MTRDHVRPRTVAVFLALLILSGTIPTMAAQDGRPTLAGTWSGTLVSKIDGETDEQAVHVVLKQEAGVISGTAGPDADRQYPIRKGKLGSAGNVTTVSFEVNLDGRHTTFDLKVADGLLKGEARGEEEDGGVRVASVQLKPLK